MEASTKKGPPRAVLRAKRSWKSRLSEVWDGYCGNTSLHCFRYLRSRQEKFATIRFMWLAVISISLACCFVLVYKVWHKWVTSPILVTFDSNTEPVKKLPIPTFVVCPMVKYRPPLLDFWTLLNENTVHNTSDEQKAKIDAVLLLCHDSKIKDYRESTDKDNIISKTSVEFLKEVAPAQNDSIECWGVSKCESYISTVLTEIGVCFTFNALPDRQMYTEIVDYNNNISENSHTPPIWTLENGYKAEGGSPLHAGHHVGFDNAFELYLSSNESDHDPECNLFRGFRVTLANPAVTAQHNRVHYYLPESGMTQMALTPRVMDTDGDLRRYSVDDRHCVYPDERRLRYFATYTQTNCEFECMINATLKKCNCIQFYMPRIQLMRTFAIVQVKGEENASICGLGKQKCIKEIIVDFHTSDEAPCRCKPACTSIRYSVEFTQSTWDEQEFIKVYFKNKSSTWHRSHRNLSCNILIIYFKDGDFIASRRSELFGYGSFIAQVGGLLGLATGFSVLSFIELFYFFTVKLWQSTGSAKDENSGEEAVEEDEQEEKTRASKRMVIRMVDV